MTAAGPGTAESPLPADAARPLLAVFSATFYVRFAFGITVAVFASYVTGHSSGLSAQQFGTAGVVSAMAPLGEFATVLLSGAAADRWGRYRVLFAGMAAAAVVFVFVATTRSPVALGAANFIFGIASGAILASSLAVIADRSGAGERGFEMGRFDAVNLSGWVGGFAFGFWMLAAIPNASLGATFVAGAAALLAGIAIASVLVRGSRSAGRSARSPVTDLLRRAFRARVLLVTLPWTAIYALIGAALVFLAPAAIGAGLAPRYVALAIAGGGAALVVTQPLYGRAADRFGRRALMSVGAAGFVSLLLLASLAIAFGPALPLVAGIGVSILPALAYGPAALAALADVAEEISRATTMAIYSFMISLGMAVGLAAAGGLVAAFGDPGLYPFFGGIAVTLVVLTALQWGRAPTPTTPAR